MTWSKDHPRRAGELDFRFANEAGRVDEEHVRKALQRHERRHTR